ncbi:MAG: D-glycerate dehydrogenase [Planctomycetota bacterium]
MTADHSPSFNASSGSTERPTIVVTRKIPGTLEPALPASVRTGPAEQLDRAALLRHVAGADVLVSMFSDRVDDELLDACGDGLRGVCNFAVGYDNIDLEACRRRGVAVSNTPDAVTEGTADMAWALLLAVARRVVEADRFVRSGAFTRGGTLGMAEWLGADLTGRTLLIVGAGRIGYATALRSIGWGMRVLYVARSKHWNFELAPIAGERVALDEGLARADVVSVHTPLTPETRHQIDGRRLGLMKPNAILINTARGPVVDEAALVEALRAGRIGGAGLDVFEREPELAPGLAALDSVVLTPHIGSAETKYREMMTAMVAANASAMLRGERPPNQIE